MPLASGAPSRRCKHLVMLRRRRKDRSPLMVAIEADDTGVRGTRAGLPYALAWSRLDEVRIETSSSGPFAEDVFFVLVGNDGETAVIPQSATTPDLIQRLQALPRFDNAAMIAAMGSAEDAQFVCWRSGVP